jgi:ABC-2 type transport system ATP-binding protein
MTPSAASVPALAVRDLSHSYGQRKALDEVSFEVPLGGFCVLLGLNGAGKTTLFSLITRLYHAQSGRIAILGHDIARQPMAALLRLGVVFQARTLDLELSAMQNLLYHGALHGLSRQEARSRGLAELDRVGLAGEADRKVREFSGGQIRRVELARSLLHRPRLLLLDEPTVGLDIRARADLLERVGRLCREEDLAVLWATHLIDEVAQASQVLVLHQGRLLASGTPGEVTAKAGALDIRDAFSRLTGRSAQSDEAA